MNLLDLQVTKGEIRTYRSDNATTLAQFGKRDVNALVNVKEIPCSHGMARSQVADGGVGHRLRRLAPNIFNKQYGQQTGGTLQLRGGWMSRSINSSHKEQHVLGINGLF
jgi:hypothetical protein